MNNTSERTSTMDRIIIRKATLGDIDAIRYIHRDCDDPWNDADECRAWVENRLERGFYIQVAELNSTVIGHGEWIVSDEPSDRFLYLGMLQVDSDFQHRGIGRKMIDDGMLFAVANHCTKAVTIPETEAGNTSDLFYKRCGFLSGRIILETTLPTGKYDCPEGTYSNHIPESVIKSNSFIFGLAQASSRHMWEVVNRRPRTDDRITPAVTLSDGGCIQLSYFQGNDTALALYWSSSPQKEIVKSILGLGYEKGLKSIEFLFFEEHRHLFEAVTVEEHGVEIYKPTKEADTID